MLHSRTEEGDSKEAQKYLRPKKYCVTRAEQLLYRVRPNWINVKCASRLKCSSVGSLNRLMWALCDLSGMPAVRFKPHALRAREIIVIRGGRSHDTSFGLPTSLLLAPRPSFVFITVNSFFINITNTFKIMPLSLHLHQRQYTAATQETLELVQPHFS